MTGRQQLAIGLLVIGITGAIAFGATRYLRKEFFPVELGSKAPTSRRSPSIPFPAKRVSPTIGGRW